MCSLSDDFIFPFLFLCSLRFYFHISLPKLGYFSYKKGNLKFLD